jgi:hypothetical protein
MKLSAARFTLLALLPSEEPDCVNQSHPALDLRSEILDEREMIEVEPVVQVKGID